MLTFGLSQTMWSPVCKQSLSELEVDTGIWVLSAWDWNKNRCCFRGSDANYETHQRNKHNAEHQVSPALCRNYVVVRECLGSHQAPEHRRHQVVWIFLRRWCRVAWRHEACWGHLRTQTPPTAPPARTSASRWRKRLRSSSKAGRLPQSLRKLVQPFLCLLVFPTFCEQGKSRLGQILGRPLGESRLICVLCRADSIPHPKTSTKFVRYSARNEVCGVLFWRLNYLGESWWPSPVVLWGNTSIWAFSQHQTRSMKKIAFLFILKKVTTNFRLKLEQTNTHIATVHKGMLTKQNPPNCSSSVTYLKKLFWSLFPQMHWSNQFPALDKSSVS